MLKREQDILKDLEACTPKSGEKMKRKREDNLKEKLEDNIEARTSSAKLQFKCSKSNSTLQNTPLAVESDKFQGGKVLKIASIF